MKKIVKLLSLVCIVTLCLVSCASFNSYERHLKDDYKVKFLDEDDIEDLAENFDVDLDDYGISKVMEVTDKDKGYYAYIIKCKSGKKAEELADDLDDVVKVMNAYYSFDVDAVVDGKFVLIGNEDVIDDALDD